MDDTPGQSMDEVENQCTPMGQGRQEGDNQSIHDKQDKHGIRGPVIIRQRRKLSANSS